MMTNNLEKYYKYCSIEGLCAKFVTKLENMEQISDNVEWVCQEKIHGSNFSFVVTNDDINAETPSLNVKVGKRSGLIKEDENFFNWKIIFERYKQDALDVYNKISKIINCVPYKIQIYGELFGGDYPGTEKKYAHVQKGVYYYDGLDFLVFDILVCTEDSSWFSSYDEICVYLENTSNLRQVPLMQKGTFMELIKKSPRFLSSIPQLYNLPPIDNNYAEGYVMKSNARHVKDAIIRPILENKNNAFSEQVHSSIKTPAELDVINQHFELAKTYCTKNRFNNLISKIGPDSKIEKIKGMFVSDLLADLIKNLDNNCAPSFKQNCGRIKSRMFIYVDDNKLMESWLDEFIKSDETLTNTN